MRWEHLSYRNFEPAVRDCAGVGVIPIGVIEPHGAHLPLGTDCFASHHIACEAALREPATFSPLTRGGSTTKAPICPDPSSSSVISCSVCYRTCATRWPAMA